MSSKKTSKKTSKKSSTSSKTEKKIGKEVAEELSVIARSKKGEKEYSITDREKELLKKHAGTMVMNYVMREIIDRCKAKNKESALINAVGSYLKNSEIRGYLQDEHRTNFAQRVAKSGKIYLLRFVARCNVKSIHHTNIFNQNLLYYACASQDSKMIKFILRKYPKVSPVLESFSGVKPFEKLKPKTLKKHPEFQRYFEITTEEYSSARAAYQIGNDDESSSSNSESDYVSEHVPRMFRAHFESNTSRKCYTDSVSEHTSHSE